MGSVLDYIDCLNCKQEAYTDYYYKTGEVYINCQHCGYHYSATYKTDEQGKYITKDGSENYTLGNLIMEEKEIKNPYGAYRYKMAGEVGTVCGAIISEEDAQKFNIEMRLEYKDHVDFAYISRVVDGEVVIEHIVEPLEEQNK